MRTAILLILACATTWGQCGRMAINPSTGRMDCIGETAADAVTGAAALPIASLNLFPKVTAAGELGPSVLFDSGAYFGNTTARTIGWGIYNRTGNTSPGTTRYVLWGGSLIVGDNNTLGNESLTDGTFTAGTWTRTGDFTVNTGAAVYTHSAGSGTFTQLNAAMAIAMGDGKWYSLVGDVATTGTAPTCVLTSATADTSGGLLAGMRTTAGTTVEILQFKSAAAPTGIVGSCTSAGAGTVSYDNLVLKEVIEGSAYLSGSLYARGATFYGGSGAITGVVRAGRSQSTADMWQWQNAAGATMMSVNYSGDLVAGTVAAGVKTSLTASGLGLDPAVSIGWGNPAYYSAKDISLFRQSAGLLGVVSNAAGKWGAVQASTYTATALATPTITSVTPSANNGVTCTYVLVLRDGTNVATTAASAAVSTGAAGPTNCATNTVVFTPDAASSYAQLSRTVGGATQGLITAMAAWAVNTTNCPAGVCTYIDTGSAASGTAPAANTTGRVLAANTPQKFFGTAAPGSVTDNLPGDLFTDTTNHNQYVCNAPSGTATPACAAVAAAGWLLLNDGGGANTVTAAAVIADTKAVLGSGGARGVAESTLTAAVMKSAAGVQSAATASDLGTMTYAVGGGSAQAQTVDLTPDATLTAGLVVRWLPVAANTAAGPSLTVDSTTTKNITKCGTTALDVGDLALTAVATAVYDGTQYQLLNPAAVPCGSGAVSMTQAVANSVDNSVSVGVGTSGRAFEKTPVTIDETTGNVSTPGSISTGSGGTVAGEHKEFELGANGSEYRSWLAPDALTATVQLKHANAAPAGSIMTFPTPTGTVSQYSWTNYAEAATASTIPIRNASGELIAANTVATTKTPMATDTVLVAAQMPTASIMSGPFSCVDGGSNDTYACNPVPDPVAYGTGTRYWFKANTINTGAATIDLHAIGVLTIKKLQGAITTDLEDGDIRAGQWVEFIYDGTNAQMMSQLGNAAAGAGDVTAVGDCTTGACYQTVTANYALMGPATGAAAPAAARALVAADVTATQLASPLPIAQGGTNCATPFAVNPQTATYQVLLADFTCFKTISVASGTFTITLVASTGQPVAGTWIKILNYGTGVVTVARSGQNINGGTTSLTIPAGTATAPSSLFVTSDASNYFAHLSLAAVTGGTCTNQAATAISAAGVPTCTTVTSAYVDSSIAPTANPVFTSSVQLPNGGPTIDAAGEIGVDTTTDQLQFYGAAKMALPSIKFFSFVIMAPVATDDILLMKAPYGMTILTVKGVLIGSTNVVGHLMECDAAGANCATVDSTADITFNGGEDADDGTLSNPSIDAGDWIQWNTTSVSGTPTALTVTVTYRVVPD